MRKLAKREYDALRRIPHLRERLYVERLLELTHSDTHPLDLAPVDNKPLPLRFLAENRLDLRISNRVIAAADNLVSRLADNNGPVAWQAVAYRNFLLDSSAKYTDRTFDSRLATIYNTPVNPPSSTEEVRLAWSIASELPRSSFVPGGHTQLRPSAALIPGVRLNARPGYGHRAGYLSTPQFDSTGARDRYLVASQLRSEATLIVNAIQVANPKLCLSVETRVNVRSDGDADGEYLNCPSIPRFWDGRFDAPLRSLLDRYNIADTDGHKDSVFRPSLRMLVNGLHWMALFVQTWWRSPVFASPMLYMALEAVYDSCVVQHRRECAGNHLTAVQVIAKSAKSVMVNEIAHYVFAAQKQKPVWRKRIRMPRVSHEQGDDWLIDLRRAMTQVQSDFPEDFDDPLLLYRINQLIERNVERDVERLATEHLTLLRRARHAIAHDGEQMKEERVAVQLAATGVEALWSAYNKLATSA